MTCQPLGGLDHLIEALQGFAEQGSIDFFQVGEVTVDGTRRITRPLGDFPQACAIQAQLKNAERAASRINVRRA